MDFSLECCNVSLIEAEKDMLSDLLNKEVSTTDPCMNKPNMNQLVYIHDIGLC